MSQLRLNWHRDGSVTNEKGEKVGYVWESGNRDWWANITGGENEGPYRTQRIARDRVVFKLRERASQVEQAKHSPVVAKAPHKLVNAPDGLDPEVVQILRERGGTWAVYENHDLSHSQSGRLVCMRYGPGCTFASPPEKAPDSAEWGLGWRYLHVGFFNPETGLIQEEPV